MGSRSILIRSVATVLKKYDGPMSLADMRIALPRAGLWLYDGLGQK